MKTYQVSGMTCEGCANNIKNKLSEVVGVKDVQTDLEHSQVSVAGLVPKFLLQNALKDTKYSIK